MHARGQTEPEFFWFDTVTVNEHIGVEHLRSWASTFKLAVGAIGHTLLVLSPWDDPIVVTRSWCLWKIYWTASTGAKVQVCLGAAERQRFFDALLDNPEAVKDALARIDSANANAAKQSDKEMIDAAIARDIDGGHSGLNKLCFEQMRECLLELAMDELDRLRENGLRENRHRAKPALCTEPGLALGRAVGAELNNQSKLDEAAALLGEVIAGQTSRRRGCHFAAPPLPSGGVSGTGMERECHQSDSLAGG